MEMHLADNLVVGHRVVLGPVVAQVVSSFFPVDSELALADTVPDPVELHVHGLGPALFDTVIDNSICHLIVCLDVGGRLGVAQSLQSVAQWAALTGIVEKAGHFSFGGRGQDHPHDTAQDVDSTIGFEDRVRVGLAAQVEESSIPGTSFALGQVGGIAMDPEEHPTGMVAQCDGGVCGSIVE